MKPRYGGHSSNCGRLSRYGAATFILLRLSGGRFKTLVSNRTILVNVGCYILCRSGRVASPCSLLCNFKPVQNMRCYVVWCIMSYYPSNYILTKNINNIAPNYTLILINTTTLLITVSEKFTYTILLMYKTLLLTWKFRCKKILFLKRHDNYNTFIQCINELIRQQRAIWLLKNKMHVVGSNLPMVISYSLSLNRFGDGV